MIKYICPECGACFHLADSFVRHSRDTGHAWEDDDEPAGAAGVGANPADKEQQR